MVNKIETAYKHLENKYPDAFLVQRNGGNLKMIISKFIKNGEEWVIVKLNNATHLMSEREWKWTYGKLHPEKWQ